MSRSLAVQHALWVCFSATVWALELWQYTQCTASLFCPGAQPCPNQSDPLKSHTLRQHLERETCSSFMKTRSLQTANTADVSVDFQNYSNVFRAELVTHSHYNHYFILFVGYLMQTPFQQDRAHQLFHSTKIISFTCETEGRSLKAKL